MIKNKPIISWVIPCYNAELTIAETVHLIKDTHDVYRAEKDLDSLWDQIEIVLVNDGSEDATREILDSLADEYSNVVRIHTKNMGKGHARNLGNEAARSDIIAVCDADDFPITDRTAYILKAFKENENKDIFYSGFVAKHLYGGISHGREEHIKARQISYDDLWSFGDFNMCHSTVAYRKKAIMEQPYSLDRNKDDWWMLWNFLTKGYKFCHNPKLLMMYIIKSNTFKKETDPEITKRILEKKRKIMRPYFEELERNAKKDT